MAKASSSKRPRYDAAFRAEALRLASESRSTLAAARALNINAKLWYQWQKATQQPLPADPQEAAGRTARVGPPRGSAGAARRPGRKALQPKAFTPRTTASTHGKRCAPNLLLDQPKSTQANRVWVSDITYLPLASGNWVYCCAFQDVCSKQVVGWQVRAAMSEALVTTALQRALLAQRPAPGLIVHSERGGQYVGTSYQTLLRNAKAQLSHSRRGECYDNAQAASLWARLKTELLEAREWPVFTDLADAQASVADYFDYYNHQRRHSSIGYVKPYLFHQQQLAHIT